MTPHEPQYPGRARAPSSGACEQLTHLVYELLDAHDDTARIATGQDLAPRWQAHLSYLRDLQRVARELLAHAGHQEGEEARDQGSASAEVRRRQYVDELIDDYVSWREACASVAASYEKWRCSDRPDKKLAFSVYVAALDREEQAATAYERAVAQVATS
jgi:hypothetical protein